MFSECFEPMAKIDRSYYVCDSKFFLDPIIDMYSESPKLLYAIVIITGERTEFNVITKKGNYVSNQLMDNLNTNLQKRQKRGGSSAARIGRERQHKEDRYVLGICEMMVRCYKNINIKGIILAGPAELKHKVEKHPLFIKYFNSLLLSVVTVEHLDVWKVYRMTYHYFNNDRNIKKYVDDIRRMIDEADERVVFGEDINEMIDQQMLRYIVCDDSIDYEVNYECEIIKCDIQILAGIPAIGVKWY